jgi:hypothetical protein
MFRRPAVRLSGSRALKVQLTSRWYTTSLAGTNHVERCIVFVLNVQMGVQRERMFGRGITSFYPISSAKLCAET